MAHFTDRTRLADAIDFIEEAKRYIGKGDRFEAVSYYGHKLRYEVLALFINGHDVNYSQNYTYSKFTVMVAYSLNGYVTSYPLRKFLSNPVNTADNFRKLISRGSRQ
ncbi:hypothetical protein [Vibrio phage vB_VhaS-a]|nr:hypothetical protein [Vibrio phage vB_VhaS-a]